MRKCCENCQRPCDYCMCPAFPKYKLDFKTKIWIIQHPLEQKKSPLKRTGNQIISFSMPLLVAWYCEKAFKNCEILVTKDLTSYKDFVCSINATTSFLLFPRLNSRELTRELKDVKEVPQSANLIFLDGTWDQAKVLFRINEQLFLNAGVILCHIHCDQGKFEVRRPPKRGSEHCVSTYEAVVHALRIVEGFSEPIAQQLFKPLQLANEQWRRNQPTRC